MADTRTAKCHECGTPIEVKVRWWRGKDGKLWDSTQLNGRSCTKCQDIKAKECQKRQDAGRRVGANAAPMKQKKLEDIAKSLGTSRRAVEKIERRAMAKVKADPELAVLFQNWMEDGGKMPATEPLTPVLQDVGRSLVDYMLELSDWYRVESDLHRRGKREEALECRREIEQFHRKFKKQLITMSLINE